jgi:SAM-dependent methyltransferase
VATSWLHRLRGGDRLVPPVRLDPAGHDFVVAGEGLVRRCAELAGLGPADRVLEVACGAGRTARALAAVLGPEGSYLGFDVDREAIGWCRRRYRGLPNFRFQVADVADLRRNPLGAHRPDEYRFPVPDASMTLALAPTSFTRRLEADADHLVAELARVLAPGGRLVGAWFLLDEDSRSRIAAGTSGLPFLDPEAHVAVVADDFPEEAVGYDAGWVTARLRAHGLEPRIPWHPGSWSGRDDHVGFEDLVVADRV